MIFPTKVYIILPVVVLHLFITLLCVNSDSQSKIYPALALIPWTLNNKSSIDIRITNGCYSWKFEEDEFIKVSNVVLRTDDIGNNCTDVVSVNPNWPYMNLRGVFTIVASDIYTGENLRSEIHIAKVESIKISTSSKRIRLGSLENLYAVGFDSELNTFTSLNGLRIVWELENDNITSDDTHGSQILVLGSKVGSVNVYAKIIEDNYTLVSSYVTIYVEEPFRITPYIRRVPFGSSYPINLIKEGTNDLNCFRKEYHRCTVDKNSEAEAQILGGDKLIVGNYNNQDTEAEFLISITCIDTRVDGSFFTSFLYLSFPKGISFAVQDNMDLVTSQNNLNFDEFVHMYFVEGEHLNERSGIFRRILQNNELTIVDNMTISVQIKMFNYKGEFLHVPINSNFDIICIKGCNLVNISSLQNEYKNDKTNNGFFEITGSSIGYSEVIVKLSSIGNMDYSSLNSHTKLSEITSSLKINVVKNISTLFSNLPLILYPGGQEIDIRENIDGGNGPFYFCSSNQSIAVIDFYTGLLKTNYVTGAVDVLVYDIGTILFVESEHTLSCESLKGTYAFSIPIFVTYINGFYLELLSSNSKLYNNTIYTSVSKNWLSIEVKANPDRESTVFSSENHNGPLLNGNSFTKLDTLDVLKLYDPCKIVETANLTEFQLNIKHIRNLGIKDCLLILQDLNVVSYSKLSPNYDSNIIRINISEQIISIELKKYGHLTFKNFIEFGVEFIHKSKVIKRKVIDIGLSINIFREISFTPLISSIMLTYIEASNAPSRNIYIEKSSKVALSFEGGLIDYQDRENILIEYNKFRLILLVDDEEKEVKGSPEEINNNHLIQIFQLDKENQFIIKCNGGLAIGYFKFSSVIFDKYQSEVYRMESILKVFCMEMNHINMFWVNQLPVVGKYTCNTRNDNCLVYHFNSKKRHRFISLAYDKDNNLLLSYNAFKIKWEVQYTNEYSMDNVEENNEFADKNVIDLFISLGSEYNMKDVNIKFEAYLPNSLEENDPNNVNKFTIVTEGIFIIPPILISPNMLNGYVQLDDYHQFEKEDDGIDFIGSWNLLKGKHQFGVIHGTNNFNIFSDDGSAIKSSFCDQQMQKEGVFSTGSILFNNFHDKVHVFPFCLDSNKLSGSDSGVKKINIYIEDRLILPKYLIKKELVFGNLNRLELIWIDRIYTNEINMENKLSWETYFTHNNALDHNNGYLYTLKIPKQYIFFLKANQFNNYFEKNHGLGNTLPCINGYYCLIDNKSKSILVVVMYSDEETALEPWQQTEFKIEIEHKIKSSNVSVSEIDVQAQSALNNFSIEIKDEGSNIFQIMELKWKNIDIELIAKVLDPNSDALIFSNSLTLKVYDSIELESNSDTFSLFSYGPPFHIGYSGGPRGFENLKLEWDIQLEKASLNNNTKSDILLIRNNNKMIIEPLGVIGNEKVSIKCFLTSIGNSNNFKALLFSKLIDVYVDVPNKIDVFSPDQEYLYLGYPKVYIIRTWNNNNTQIPHFHYSQYFPSKNSRCRVTWSINQNLYGEDYISGKTGNNICDTHSNSVCISSFSGKKHINKFSIDPKLVEDRMHNQISMYDYTVLLYPMNIGTSYLNVRFNCNFGYREKLELEYTQKLNVLRAINSVENGIWIVKDSFYYFSLPKDVIINSSSELSISYSNNSQIIHLNTWNSSKSVVIFNKERRFELEAGDLITVSPIIISDPRMAFIELDRLDDYSVKLSLTFFNSMGIRLYPNQNYCYGLNLHLIPVHNGVQNIFIREESDTLMYRNTLGGSTVFEESSLNDGCQFVLKQNPESIPSMLINHINSWRLIGSNNHLNTSSMDSCFIIQIYSNANVLIGSQPFCIELNNSNSGEYYEYGDYVYGSEHDNLNSLVSKTAVYEFEVLAGSLLHLNPIKWKVLNSFPNKLKFCVIVDKFLKDLDSLLREELSKISNVPLTLIDITHKIRIKPELFGYLNISSSNKQLVCIYINRKIDPFEFWVALMKDSSIIFKSYGVFWIGMNEGGINDGLRHQDSEYNSRTPIWELISHSDSVKVIENELLLIPRNSSIEHIGLRLSNFVQINLKVITISNRINQSDDFVIVNNKHDIVQINAPFSFSIYSNENNELVNKYFSNIYYSPIIDIDCDVYNPILREIYTTIPYWSLNTLNGPFLLPSCNMVPYNSDISGELLSDIMNNDYTQHFMYILPEVTKTTFNIKIQLSSEKLQRSIPIHFYPILIKSLSSPIFSNRSTFFQSWVNGIHHMEIIVPFNSINDYKLPIRILFWFGYMDVKLVAYTIRSHASDEYAVSYTPYNLQGEINISKNKRIDSYNSKSNLTLPLSILLEFELNGQKHQISILLENRHIQNLTEAQKAVTFRYFLNLFKAYKYIYMMLTSLAVLIISVLYFQLNKKQVVSREINSSPFRKLNTQKW